MGWSEFKKIFTLGPKEQYLPIFTGVLVLRPIKQFLSKP